MSKPDQGPALPKHTNRREMLRRTAGAAVLGAAVTGRTLAAEQSRETDRAVKNGRIKQSIVQWCFADHWDIPQTIQVAKRLGCGSVELIEPKFFPMLKDNGLECAIGTIDMSPDPPFVKGFNNPKYREQVLKATRDAIDACAQFGFKKVITFTGMREGIPDDVGAKNCVSGYKEIVGHAERKGVTLCLEMLNSRVSDHPMKGHPGYQGDHTDYCIDIIQRVGSPNLKLLFDIYHVQIMDGDLIRRIRQLKDLIAHVHTAGNPGRGELDMKQEITYKPVMEALIEIGYQGFVGQEFIPTRDPLQGLREAVTLCDV
ncbi:MAG TPA: TIM barrel protein [Isosphaeraceae bacterium]|nr:TIM barrel protein [Isosphaeraceae bacterium]